MTRAVLIFVTVHAMSACGTDDAGFLYPRDGDFGLNLLDPALTVAEDHDRTGAAYSFRVEGPEDPNFELILTLLSPIPEHSGLPGGIWYCTPDPNNTWAIGQFDWETGAQRFVATPVDKLEPGVSDMSMLFKGTGAVRLDYYENGDAEPTKTKRLDWE